jgi:hypothetical protein
MRGRLLLGGLVFLGACSGAPAPRPGPSEPPTLVIAGPASDTVATRGVSGGFVTIEYADNDPDSEARTTLWAEKDGGLVEIAVDRPHGAGAVQRVEWDTAGVAPGRYRILGETRDADSTATASSPGHVNVVDPLSRSELGSARDWASGVDTYPDGSFVVTGTHGLIYPLFARVTAATITFGAGGPNETAFTTGAAHAFVARYEADGTLAWARTATGGGDDIASSGNAVAALPDGGCLVTGSCYAATFGKDEPNETRLVATSLDDAFLARYDADGTLVWAKLFATGSFGEWPTAIAVADDGSYVIAGSFIESMVFEDGTRLTTDGTIDLFAARFDQNGALVWAHQVTGPGADHGRDVALRDDGSCVVAGEQYRLVGAAYAITPVLLSLTADGALEWSRSPDADAATAGARGYGCSVLPDGSAVLAGTTAGDVVLSDGTLLGSGGSSLLVRYDRSGTPLWGRRFPGSAHGVRAIPDGLVLAGKFSGTATIGPDTLVSAGEDDLYVARCGLDGTFAWARAAGGTLYDAATALACFPDGSAMCAGSVARNAAFGNMYVGRVAADGTQG